LKIRPLPGPVNELLNQVGASPRLVAHLALTHELALCIVQRLAEQWPGLEYDRQAVLFGAATHDIGKTCCPEELTGPGKRHERVGEELLLRAGFRPEDARFARTHGQCCRESPLEDLLVALADTAWKGKRDNALEDALVERISRASGEEPWRVYLVLDDLIMALGHEADARLDWQRQHPV